MQQHLCLQTQNSSWVATSQMELSSDKVRTAESRYALRTRKQSFYSVLQKLPWQLVSDFNLIGLLSLLGYGLTETTGTVVLPPLDGRAPRGCIGVPVASTQLKVKHSEFVVKQQTYVITLLGGLHVSRYSH